MIVNVYQRGRKINSGGICDVYELTRESDGLRVAGKFAKPQFAGSFECRQRAIREGALVRNLHLPYPHPHVIRLIDFNLSGEGEFLAFELMQGSLLDRLDAGMEDDEKFLAIAHASEGLALVHSRGQVHRDIKPGNILHDGAGVFKVADLNCAKAPGIGINLTRGTIGTLGYAAPEQYAPRHFADRRSDVYGLGATVHHLFFGAPPTYEKSTGTVRLSDKVHRIHQEFHKLLWRMLHPDPDRRFQSIREFLEAWRRLKKLGVLVTPIDPSKGPSLGEVALIGGAVLGGAIGLAAVLKALFGGRN